MYRRLPPGYNRRMEYSRYIRRMRLRERRNAVDYASTFGNSLHLFGDTSYENFSTLEDVETGVICKDLYKHSVVRNSEGVTFCAVCQSDIMFDIVRELKCKHSFHINCIDHWLTMKNTCPICKALYGRN